MRLLRDLLIVLEHYFNLRRILMYKTVKFNIIKRNEMEKIVGGRKYNNAYQDGRGFGNMAKWLIEGAEFFL